MFSGLVAESGVQYGLFEETAKIAKNYESVDELSRKYGKHAVQQRASLPTKLQVIIICSCHRPSSPLLSGIRYAARLRMDFRTEPLRE